MGISQRSMRKKVLTLMRDKKEKKLHELEALLNSTTDVNKQEQIVKSMNKLRNEIAQIEIEMALLD